MRNYLRYGALVVVAALVGAGSAYTINSTHTDTRTVVHTETQVSPVSASSPTGPPIYPFKAIIPLAAIFMLLQGTVEVVRCLVALRTGQTPQRRRDVDELEKLILEEAKEGKTADQILRDVEHHGEKS